MTVCTEPKKKLADVTAVDMNSPFDLTVVGSIHNK